MKTIYVDVDTQFDFCDPKGALFVGGAEALGENFRAIVKAACAKGAAIVGSVDSHAFDAWEFAGAIDAGPNGERPNFPPHCVKGTRGWLKVDGTIADRARFVPNVVVDDRTLEALIEKHAPQQILLEKEVYSLFANPNAERVLDRVSRGEPVRFVVFGVATDYCVRAAAIGCVEWLAKRGRFGEVDLVADAIAAVDAEGGKRALEEMKARGVKLVATRDVV